MFWPWLLPIILLIIPFIYGHFAEKPGDYQIPFGGILVVVICWTLSIGILIGLILSSLR